LAIGVNAEKMLREEIGRYFELKEESFGPPTLYLGGKLCQVILDNGMKVWGIRLSQFVQAAVNNVKKYLEEQGSSLPRKADTPMQTSYCPMLDVSPELDSKESSYYMSLIGILRWMVEFGRVDICLEVSMLSSHLALPRRGHMDQVLNIFAYLKAHHNAEIVLDASGPVIDENDFTARDWTSSDLGHVQGKEELPGNQPKPRGLGFMIHAKVDADQ
jgi:hypothetical protein